MAQPYSDGLALALFPKLRVMRGPGKDCAVPGEETMSMSGPNDTKEEHGSQEPQHGTETGETGHSGEGAASALAHMISSSRRQRHQSGEADDAAGSHHS
jgi:hypothetical protein